MKKLLAVIALCAALAVPASAQLTMTGVGGGFGGAAALPTFTNFAKSNNTSCGFVQTCTVSGVTTAAGFNVVAAIINNATGSTVTITQIDLCGTTLTLQGSGTGRVSGTAVALAYGTVAGGSCNIAVTASVAGAITRTGVAVGLLSNLNSTTPGTGCSSGTNEQPDADNNYTCTAGITVSANGFGVAAIGYSVVTTMTSSTLTIDVQDNVSFQSVGLGHSTASNTPAFTGGAGADGGIVAAPWR